MSGVRQCLTDCLDGTGAAWSNVLIGLGYATTSCLALAVIALNLNQGDDTGMLVLALIFVCLAVIAHFLIGITGIALVEGYHYYPTNAGVPKVLLASTDVLQAMAFGLSIGSYTLTDDAKIALLLSTGVVFFAHLMQTYKAYVITRQVAAGIRRRKSGALKAQSRKCDEFV